MVGRKQSPAPQESGMQNNDRGTGGQPASQGVAATLPAASGSRWLLRNWRLRYKMAAVLLVPTLAALGVGGIRVYDGLQTASELNTIVEQVDLAQRAADVTHELQQERDLAVVVTTSNHTLNTADYQGQAAKVDAAVGQLRAMQDQVPGFSSAVRNAYTRANERLDGLTALRGAVNQGFTEPGALVTYNSVIASTLDINREVANSATNTQVNRTAQASEAIGEANEQHAQQRSILLGAALSGGFLSGQTDDVRAADAQFDAAFAQFQSVATAQQSLFYSARVAGPTVDDAARIKQSALIAAEAGRPLAINPPEWGSASATTSQLVWSVQQELLGDFHDSAAHYADAAQWAAIRDAALILALLLLAFGFAVYIARSMLGPLRTLRSSALDVAQKGLPDAIQRVNERPEDAGTVQVDPVPVYTREEIGQVARSFDAVHSQALRMASEQALLRTNVNDLFVNLARRSQTLVQRQLSLIDRLEQDEQDPDQLSSLFELDHLATRMRRNNENLLILGGTDLTQRVMRPVALAEVVGAAVSEVEQYARIAVAESPELAIQGRVVNDFVHLIAELLENATVYSNPDTEVTVRTVYRRQDLVLEIHDRGVGIDEADLAEINERLIRPPEVDVAVSRRMGLYVVGQLARRHNIRVTLQNNEDLGGGVSATVYLSGEYVSQLTPDGPMPMPGTSSGAEEQRELTSDTGNNLGIAAAFGRGGVADRSLGSAESNGFPTHQEALPSRNNGERHVEPDEPEPVLPSTNFEPSTPYSVQFASGDSFGATDIPAWPDISGSQTQENHTVHRAQLTEDTTEAAHWPVDQGASLSSGGTQDLDSRDESPVGFDSPGALFHSPYEAEKTTQLPAVDDSLLGDSGGLGDSAGSSEIGAGDPSSFTSNADTAYEMDDAPTQRLPIYEAVLSQWFRESDVDEQPGGSTRGSSGELDFSTGSSSLGGLPQRRNSGDDRESRDDSSLASNGSVLTGSTPGTEESSGEPRAAEPEDFEIAAGDDDHAGSRDRHALSDRGDEQLPDPGWGSADAGWQAAEALVQHTREAEATTTAAGLPKRVPKSNLVPGSAAPPRQQQPSAPRKPVTSRSADAVRGRMSNFQQGVRRGRHAKPESVSTEPPHSIPSRHEEQE
jgi:signal transduction histidine kinase